MTNEEQSQPERKYQLALTCEVRGCGEPLKLLRINGNDWFAQCSDEQCAVLHQGSF